MAWSGPIYTCHPDEGAARAAAAALGVEFPDNGSIPSGNQNYALHAPMQPPWATPPVLDGDGMIVTPGVPETGYWSMLRLNMDWPGYEQAIAAIQLAGVLRELDEPPAVWA